MADTDTADAATQVAGIRYTAGTRPQDRFSFTQTVSNTASGSFQPIQLAATGWVRKIRLDFTQTVTFASAGAAVAGDAPWNLISGITLTDATGQPIQQPISAYNQYLLNKYFGSGVYTPNYPSSVENPHVSDFRFSVTGTAVDIHWSCWIDAEQDRNTGYGSIPNVDSNASLQLKIDYAPYTVAATGTTPSAVQLTVTVSSLYWAPVGKTLNGQPLQDSPVGAGDYLETRYETQTVNPGAENLVTINNRGGMVKGVILVSRNAGVRTAFTGGNVGTLLDNVPIDEGIRLNEYQQRTRQIYGYFGADLNTNYAPPSAGVAVGLDTGVLVNNFSAGSGGRDSWLSTRAGSLLQMKITPGAGASQLEIITLLMQVRDTAAFFAPSALY